MPIPGGEMDLSGKIVLVTGAQQGIGRAIALHCAAAGADVAVNWLDDEAAAKALAGEIRAAGRRALTVQADVASLAAVEAMVAAVEDGLGPIDALVNNAGVFPRVPFLELRESDWDYVLDVNLKGTCFCTQAVAKRMVAAGRPGAIIAPGLTDTAQPRYGSSEDEIAAAAQTIPLGRIAQPDDIARTAVFLASDEAGFTTGQILHVNGGGYFG